MKHLKPYDLFENFFHVTSDAERIIDDALDLWKSELPTKGSMIGPLFYGTKEGFDGFDEDFERTEETSPWDFDLPEGMVFLTTDPKEARHYGSYIVPVYLRSKKKDIRTVKVASWNPSGVFDDNYSYGGIDMSWDGYNALEVRGTGKSTYVAYPNISEPDLDLAMLWNVSPNDKSVQASDNEYIKRVK